MGSIGNFFGASSSDGTEYFIDRPFYLNVTETNFIKSEIIRLYKKLMQDCYSRSTGLKDSPAYFDNCLVSENNKGLISLLAEYMYLKQDLYLVLIADIVRVATAKERAKIKADYNKSNKSSTGIVCSFKNFDETTTLQVYYSMLYNVFDTTNTQMNMSKAIQIKIEKLRELVGLSAKDSAIPQAKLLVEALKNGKGIMLDVKDVIETIKSDLAPVEAGINLVNQQIAKTLGMPLSYVSGQLSTGLSTTGEGDSDAVERGLRPYFNSIWKPTVDTLFKTKITFKSDSWRALEPMLKYIPVIETSDLLSSETKEKYATAINDRL